MQCAQYVLGHHGTVGTAALGLAIGGAGRQGSEAQGGGVARKLAILLHVLWKHEADSYGSQDPKPPVEAAPVSGSGSEPAG